MIRLARYLKWFGIVLGVLWLVGIVVMLCFADSLFADLTPEQTQKVSENFTYGTLGAAAGCGVLTFLLHRINSARNRQDKR